MQTSKNTIDVLIDSLKSCSGEFEDYNSIFQQFGVNKEDFQKFIFWDEEHYTRNVLYQNDDFELVLLCWEKRQGSGIHDHDLQKSWIKVVEGKLIEERYVVGKSFHAPVMIGREELEKGSVTSIDDVSALHAIINEADQNAISIHLYVKPIKFFNQYDKEALKWLNVETMNHSVTGVELDAAKD